LVCCVCAGEVVVMAESRAEIDTAAPFASVKDALNIFGEGSCTRVQRNFTIGPSADQRMASLEAELHLAHTELAKLKEQLAASENNKDLCTLNEQLHDESTCHLEEKENLQEDLFPAAEDGNDSWQAQLDAALEQQRNTDDQETVRKEIERLQAELDVVNREYVSTAANLACALNDIQSLREGMQGLIDAKALAEGQAGHFSTVAEMSAKRVDELTKDLSAMEESLSKANESRMEAEREFRTTLAAESKRLAAVANNAAAEVANLDEKVKETEAKLVSAIADLEKMEQELSSTKEREQNALKAEVAANLNLQRMKIDVEDAKVATEKVPDKSASLGHTVVECL
jgi:DNA repair exonuclease SbcCD ATPase subunit